MNNYEYIIASLPVLGKDAGSVDADALVQSVRNQCSDSDNALIDKLLDLTQIVYKYIPGDSMTEELNELVFGIMQLSSDLEKHAILEEKVLIPYMNQILNASSHETKD